VGDHEVDASGTPMHRAGPPLGPLEENYEALRHQLWRLSDSAYKEAVGQYEQAVTQRKQSAPDEDRPASFSKEAPATSDTAVPETAFDVDRYERLAKRVSAVFRDYEQIHASEVGITTLRRQRWFVSSEGSLVRDGSILLTLDISAHTQAEDGAPLQHGTSMMLDDPQGLADEAKVVAEARRIAEQLTELRAAPTIEGYTGPVLFEGRAAAQMVAHVLAPSLATSRWDKSIEGKLGQRVLPTWMSVVDDPSLTSHAGQKLLGHYVADAEGVVGKRVELVQRGKLASLLTTRTPTKKFPSSNGHARGFGFMRNAAISNLVLASKRGTAAIERKLLKQMKTEGLDHGLIVSDLGGGVGRPRLVYRIDKSGKRELVRGVTFRPPEPKVFRNIVATSKAAGAHHFVMMGGMAAPTYHRAPAVFIGFSSPATVVTPDLLFEEIELQKIEGDNPKLPLYPHPHFK
jgi:predicted Zn-dependent protease